MDLFDKNNEIYFKGFIVMMEYLSELWGIKDLNFCYIYMNKVVFFYINIFLSFEVEGKMDYEFFGNWIEFVFDLIEYDKWIEEM